MIQNLQTLAKTSVDNTYDFIEIQNQSTGNLKKLLAAGLFPTMSTTGTGGQDLFISVTNKNQLNFKGIKSADTTKLTATTDTNNILLTLVESGIDLSNCSNKTSGFLTAMDFTGIVTGVNPVVNGGTGLETIAKGALLYASADDTITATSPLSTNGQLLIGNETTGIPTLATLTAGAGVSITNSAGSITIAATIANATANIDLYDGSATTYNVDTNNGDGWISGDGTDEGIAVDNSGKVFVGQSTPTAAFDESLNIKGSIRFTNDTAPTIKPSATTSDTVGQKLTIEGGSSASGNAGDLALKAGTAGSGGGNGGNVDIYAGSEAGGTAGAVSNYVYDGSGSAIRATSIAGGSATPDLRVTTGNLKIAAAAKGIVHEGSGTVTQATDHTTGVTINATSGVITLAAVALANATNAEFTVTNSTVQADSVILVTMQDENTTNNAQLSCAIHTIAGGSFKISIHHADSVGATSTTASKIHFLVINNS
jgi:hypothetical protein